STKETLKPVGPRREPLSEDNRRKVIELLKRARRQRDRLKTKIKAQAKQIEAQRAKIAAQQDEISTLKNGLSMMTKEADRLSKLFSKGGFASFQPGANRSGESIFRELAKKYHPDHNPASGEFMKDLNRLHDAIRKKR